MVVGLLAMLFVIVFAYITLARVERVMQRELRAGGTVDQIADSTHQLVLTMIRQQLADGAGHIMSSESHNEAGFSHEDIPGVGGSRIQAGLEPFFHREDPTAGSPVLKNYRQFVSSTGPYNGTGRVVDLKPPGTVSGPPGVRIGDMVATQGFALSPPRGLLPETDSSNDSGDFAQLARRPYADADGDGVPDSTFEHLLSLQELANAMAGSPVRAPLIDPYAAGSIAWQRWRRFDNLARYEISLRVVPHGGMVSLDSAVPLLQSTVPRFNRDFVERMFAWVRHSKDPRTVELNFKNLPYHKEEIEPFLRRRFLLAPMGERGGSAPPRIPQLLRKLEEEYKYTFGVSGDRSKGPFWQRFNLAEPTERKGWLDAVRVDTLISIGDNYDRRHLITMISNSDNLARNQTAPWVDRSDPLDPIDPIGTIQGELKFNLQRIKLAFQPPPNNWKFRNDIVARQIVKEIADFYYDMLASHDFVGTETILGEDVDSDAGRRRQALMLAVNTVAFAAPRGPNGKIDVVYYEDKDPGDTAVPGDEFVRTYVGYAPQPVFSEVKMYYGGDNESHDEFDVAVALELYNPHEVLLALDDFAIGFGGHPAIGGFAPEGIVASFLGETLAPHQAIGLVIQHDTDTNNAFGGGGLRPLTFTGSDRIPMVYKQVGTEWTANLTLFLLRRSNSTNLWFVVDEITLTYDPLPEEPKKGAKIDWFVSDTRDTNLDAIYTVAKPRWGTAVGESQEFEIGRGKDVNDPEIDPPGTTSLGNIDDPAVDPVFVPHPPLYTMNAQFRVPTDPAIHGSLRPNSFPTVGFLLFVPRYSHVSYALDPADPDGILDPTPASRWLAREWDEVFDQRPGWEANSYGADFGHMPVFDNNQNVEDEDGYFGSDDARRAGRVPWGQLVFDYFTTLDAGDIPGDDPMRIPARININLAPWFVLAGLPVVEPSALDYLGTRTASPAFWDADRRLFDSNPGNDERVHLDMLDLRDSNWFRLSAPLALSIASYRDRVAHQSDDFALYPGSDLRNLPLIPPRNIPQYRSGVYGDIRREKTGDPKKFGFTSLGELANIKGFDNSFVGQTLDPLDPANPDFMRAVAFLALLDSQFLTTRSNTFTVYATITDRVNPAASVRSQVTIDRTNTLPRAVDTNGNGFVDATIESSALPRIIGQRQIGYFNAAFDD